MLKKLVLSLIPMALLLLTACAPAAENGDLPQDPAVPSVNGQNEILWITESAPITLDPIRSIDVSSNWVMAQMYNGLTWFNPATGVLEPRLAYSFEHVDPYTWIFELRQGVYFHDGAYFDADVAVLNFERALDPEEFVPNRVVIAMMTDITALGPYTLQFTTEFPFAPLAANLTSAPGWMVSPPAIEEERNGGYLVSERPVGTGPYRLVYHEHGHTVLMERFNDHFAGPALTERVRMTTIPEAGTRFAMVEGGDAHGIQGQPADYAVARGIAHLDTMIINSSSFDYMGFNMNHEILSDVRVRRAISMAIDRQTILTYLAEGMGILAEGLFPPILAHAPGGLQALPYDPEAARALLEEAGFGDGFTINLWYNDGDALRSQVSEFVQGALASFGIEVIVTSMEWGAYLEQTAVGNQEMFLLNWVTGTGDSDQLAFPNFHSSQQAGGNRVFYGNPEMDALILIERGRMSTDPAERYAIYEEIALRIIEEAPMVFLRFSNFVYITNGIDGLEVNFGTIPFFHNVTIR